MYLYDSSIMAEKYQLFWDGTYYKVLPRTYHNIKLGECGNGVTNSTWFKEFLQDVENQVLQFLYINLDDCTEARSTLHTIILFKNMGHHA